MSHEGDNPTLCIAGVESAPPVDIAVFEALKGLAQARGWKVRYLDIRDCEEMDETTAIVVLAGAGSDAGRRAFPHSLILSAGDLQGADLALPLDAQPPFLSKVLEHGEDHWRRNLKIMALFREVGARRQRMNQLSDIALSLSTRMDFAELLKTILLEARRLADCEAGSLYLIDEVGEESELVFKLAQNDVVNVPYVERRLALSSDSLAGYVAVSGEELLIEDVYQLPESVSFRFNRSFDEQMNYRTKSMLVLPMRDHRDQVVGVLQFINRRDPTEDEPVSFDDEIVELLRAVASQAAVSIQKNQLIRDISRLFESFVQASVKTIEQRDPSTSGHSFRVADSTVALLQALPMSGHGRFRNMQLSEEHIREVRYAALLHDFGKVGVRENILLKANKLTDDRLEIVQHRIELQKERLRRRAVERELEMLHHGPADIEVQRRRIHRRLEAEVSLLDDYFGMVVKANLPKVLEEDDARDLREIREYAYREFDGTLNGLITDMDLLALSVRKGSLTPDERREIQSHVTHTREFLAVLPWPPELARVPEIAAAHHEKLDGSGYPQGLTGEQIPLASRVMTVCDIYDALTAMDRPYKKAMTPDYALRILGDEVRQGLLDADLVQIFIESRIYQMSVQTGAERRVV